MIITYIFGSLFFILGIFIAVYGCIQSRKKIKGDLRYIQTDGEIIGFDERISKIKYKSIITVVKCKEYTPIIRYTTEKGQVIESADLPYTLKISPDYKEYYEYYRSGERITIKYNPEFPEKYFYKSRKFQYIREAFYKIIIGFLISGIGCAIFMIK
ncbi:MAG: DUF3592 domain-containing protein [Oscillospiraceae bacterium]|nr:DUF3592 domain-containing protein [Oscillospiraceae bacterium]